MAQYFLALLGSLLDVTDTVIYKRVAEITERERIDRNFLFFLGYVFVLAVLPAFWFFLSKDFLSDVSKTVTDLRVPLLLATVSGASIAAGYFNSYAYANEKISSLAPYSQVSSILSIVMGFFLFRETTDVAVFVGAVVASVAIFLSNIRGGRLAFGKYQIALSVSGAFAAVAAIASAYLVEIMSPFGLVFGQAAFGLVILAVYGFFHRKDFRLPTKGNRKPFVWGLFTTNMLWVFSCGIGLFLYSSIGIVAAILLSMISLVVALVLSYLFYKDRPSTRDVLVAVVVMLCIGASST